jgi:hypothetical protein
MLTVTRKLGNEKRVDNTTSDLTASLKAYLVTHFATDVLFQWQNGVSFDSFCHSCSFSVAKRVSSD